MKQEQLAKFIAYAKGEQPVELLVKNARIVNTFSGEIIEGDLAIAEGVVVGIGDYKANKVIDARGRFVVPGLIEGHIHIESTLLAPAEFAKISAEHGTAAIVCDPHEIANVLGEKGIKYLLDSTAGMEPAIYVMAPSCVPATHLENAGAVIEAEQISALFRDYPDRVLGLAEMMNFPGVLFKVPQVLAKLSASQNKPIDGHAPMLSGKDLAAYIIAGPASDHECTAIEEAREKLRLGMHIMIREGTAEHNLDALVAFVNEWNSSHFSLVSDDRHPHDLKERGHLDYSVRRAISKGIPSVRAIQMASINTARYFRLCDRGALLPGYKADFSILEGPIESFKIEESYLGGKPAGALNFEAKTKAPGNTMNVAKFSKEALQIKATGKSIRVIGIVPGQIITKSVVTEAKVENGLAVADAVKDLAKMAVIERHKATGNIGLGFVKGVGLKRGAIALTVAHDSHNLIVIGMNDSDMYKAAEAAIEIGGGFVAVNDGKVCAKTALPIAGLMSDKPFSEVIESLNKLNDETRKLGGGLENPFMTASFLALPVIPELKLTDRGLVDVGKFDFVPLFID